MTDRNHDFEPEDPMMHRMAGGEHDMSPLMEAQMIWMKTGLEGWYQKFLDAVLQDMVNFHNPNPDNPEATTLLEDDIKDIQFAKRGETPVLVTSWGYHKKRVGEEHDTFDLTFFRAGVRGNESPATLGFVTAIITVGPQRKDAKLTPLRNLFPDISNTVSVTPELARNLLRLIEIDAELTPSKKQFQKEDETRRIAARELLSSIE